MTVTKKVLLSDFVAFKASLIETKKYSTGKTINTGVLRNFKSRLLSAGLIDLYFECDDFVYELFNKKIK